MRFLSLIKFNKLVITVIPSKCIEESCEKCIEVPELIGGSANET
jgi:hypothetical protein